jgi:uncharacterized membrane protein YhhN
LYNIDVVQIVHGRGKKNSHQMQTPPNFEFIKNANLSHICVCLYIISERKFYVIIALLYLLAVVFIIIFIIFVTRLLVLAIRWIFFELAASATTAAAGMHRVFVAASDACSIYI